MPSVFLKTFTKKSADAVLKVDNNTLKYVKYAVWHKHYHRILEILTQQ